MASSVAGSPHPLARRVAEVVTAKPDGRAVEYAGQWHDWASIATAMTRIDGVIDETFADRAADPPAVGVLVRNRPLHVALLLAVVRRGGCFVVINPSRGADSVRADVAALNLRLVLGEAADIDPLTRMPVRTALAGFTSLGGVPQISYRPDDLAEGPVHPGVAIQMLTSGTTGPPKRVDLTYDALDATMRGVTAYYGAGKPVQAEPPPGVAIVNSPLAHLGGVFRVLQCVLDQRSFVLLERFEVDSWLRAVRTYRPTTASLVPTALRMILEASPDPADLASLRAVTSGTAALSPDDADAFTERYGVPVLTSYAATEFAGGVAGWTLPDYQRFAKSKRGSVGRPNPGTSLRIIDPDSGTVCPPDEPGLLEVKPAQLGPDVSWIRTTDLARIDPDGFLYILGRADGVIIRGGFKVMPDRVRGVLEEHPDVRGAVVLGVPDERLGAVPVALVELRSGAQADGQAIAQAVAGSLAGYERPTEIHLVDELPRTPSGKVDLRAATELLPKVRK